MPNGGQVDQTTSMQPNAEEMTVYVRALPGCEIKALRMYMKRTGADLAAAYKAFAGPLRYLAGRTGPHAT